MISAVSIARISRSLLIIGSVLLHACGGGGGGGGGGENSSAGSTSGNNPNQPPVIKKLLIDNSNATEVLTVAGSTYEAFFELASLGIVSIDLANKSVTQWQNIGCDKNGTFNVSLVDRDGNQFISAGDSVAFTYSRCDMRVVGGEVSGTLNIDVASFSTNNSTADWVFVGVATIDASIKTAGGTVADVSGPYRIEYQKNAQGDGAKVSSATTPLSVNIALNEESSKHTYNNVNIMKTYDTTTSKYSVSGGFYAAFDFDEIQCNAINSLEGTQLYLPDTGLIECLGANNSAVRGGPGPINNFIYGLWFVDLNSGSGAFSRINNVIVSGYFDGALFTPVLLDQPYGVGAGSNLLSNIQIISYATSTAGKVYVVTASAAPTLPKRLIEIDPLTGGAVRSILLAEEPTSLAVAPDGSLIYVGYQNSTGVDIFDTAQWSSAGRVTIGSDLYQPSNSTFTVNNIVVALNKNYIVVEAQSTYGTDPLLFAFQDGVRLQNSTTLPVGFSYFVKKYIYDSVSNLLFYRENNQLPINYVQLGATGLTNSTVLASVGAATLWGSGNGFDIYNGKIFSADGGVTDVSSKNNIGYIPCNQSACVTSFENTIVDSYLKQVIYIGSVNSLQVYDINSRISLGSKFTLASKMSVLNRNQLIYQAGNNLGFIGKGTPCWMSSAQCSVN